MTSRIVSALAAGLTSLSLVAQAMAGDGTELHAHLIISVEEGDSTVGIYDSKTGNELSRIDLGYVKDTQREKRRQSDKHRSYVGMWPHEIALSRDHKTAYVTHFGLKDYDELIGATGSTISVIDVEKMCEIRRLYTFGFIHRGESIEEQYYKYRAPHGVKLQPSTSKLFVNVEANLNQGDEDQPNNHHMLIYDLESGSNVPSDVWDIPEKTHNFIFSRDGNSLWLLSGPDGVYRFNAMTGEQEANFKPTGGAIRGLILTKDDRQLIAFGSGEVIILESNKLTHIDTIPVSNVKQFLYGQVKDDFLIAPAVWEGQVVVVDLRRRMVARRLVVGSDPVHVKMAPGQRSVYVTHGRDNYISELDISRLPSIREVRKIKTHDGPNGLAVAEVEDTFSPHRFVHVRPQRKKIRFGACLPLSGQNIVEGQDMRLGYQFWRDMVNSRGGVLVNREAYDVELVFRDTESVSKGPGPDATIRRLTQEMIKEADDDGVAFFLLGTYPTPPNISSGVVADNAGIPLVTAGAAGVVVYEKGFKYVFGVMSPARGFLNPTMDMMLSKKSNVLPKDAERPKSIVFISSDDFGAFQDSVTTGKHVLSRYPKIEIHPVLTTDVRLVDLKSFKIHTEPADKKKKTPAFHIVTYEHPERDDTNADPDWKIKQVRRDFPELLRRIKSSLDADVISLTGHMPQAIDFVKAGAEVWPMQHDEKGDVQIPADYPKAIVLSVGPGNPSFVTELGELSANLIGASVWSPNQRQFGLDPFIESRAFQDKYVARFHKKASYLTAGAVVSGLVYEEAFRRADSVDPAKIRDALQSISDPKVYQDNKLAKGPIDLFYSRIDFRFDSDKRSGSNEEPVVRGLNDQRPLGAIQLQKTSDGEITDVVLWPPSLAQEVETEVTQAGKRIQWPFPGFPVTPEIKPRALFRKY